MASSKSVGFKKGDVFIGQGTVYKVTKIEDRKNMEGNVVSYLIYEPFFKTKRTSTLLCSMPVGNIDKTNKRDLASKEELKKLLLKLEETIEKYEPPTPTEVTEVINGAELEKRLEVLKNMWLEKKDPATKLSISKIGSFKKIHQQASQEIAAIMGKALEDAEALLDKKLLKALPESFLTK
jgi:RNA polymerase-interacting CarD/CdnL/TRCF family regulator